MFEMRSAAVMTKARPNFRKRVPRVGPDTKSLGRCLCMFVSRMRHS